MEYVWEQTPGSTCVPLPWEGRRVSPSFLGSTGSHRETGGSHLRDTSLVYGKVLNTHMMFWDT